MTNQIYSVPANSNQTPPPSSSSSTFCSSGPTGSSIQSIVVSAPGSTNDITLSLPDRPNSIVSTAKARGSLYVFTNPPASQCYLINFPSTNSINMNNVQVKFIYHPTSSSNTARSIGGGYPNWYGSNSNSGKMLFVL